MTVTTLKHEKHRCVRSAFRGRSSHCDGFEALEKSDIAELSDTAINQMTCDELVRMIRFANLPALLRPELDRHLPFYDHLALTRLAHLARRCCCNQRPGSFRTDAE